MNSSSTRGAASAASLCCRALRNKSARRYGLGARPVLGGASPRTPRQMRELHAGWALRASYSVPPPSSRTSDAESAASAVKASASRTSDISKSGFSDAPPLPTAGLSSSSSTTNSEFVDWTRSYQGLSATPFSKEASDVLQAPLDPEDVEIKPDGILYLPEIKYRRILNKAFGPGGWGLAPRGETIVTGKAVTREYALVALGRLVSVARGEQDYFSQDGIPTAAEGCKSNALMRCSKDLGIASELWDPRFIREFMKKHIKEVWVEHVTTKKKKKIYIRKDGIVAYPFKETKP